SITVNDPNLNGRTLEIRDGINTTVIFEFDDHGVWTSGRTPIDISAAPTANDVAVVTASVINGVGAALEITATSAGNVVTLTHDRPGTFGNQSLATSTNRLTLSNMSGGAGYDCAEGVACTQDADCSYTLGLVCVIANGQAVGTCQVPPVP
ncbi:MAG TPA: hypothetical protein VLQ93_02680, partial [Myxococcaceae bacterium]|nr:hypothetical protein [Myxococcaceae bacterium]